MNTFILPAIEIEEIIDKLTLLRDETVALSKFPTSIPSVGPAVTTTNDYEKINNMITNWNTILDTYRSQNGDSTTAFNNEMKLYNDVVNSFSGFQNKQDSSADVAAGVQGTIKGLQFIYQVISKSLVFQKTLNPLAAVEIIAKIVQTIIFLNLRGSLSSHCNDKYVLNQKQFDSYATNMCQDFSAKRWTQFSSFMNDACSMSLGFDSSSNDVAQFYGHLCMNGQSVDPNNYPGGVESSGTSQSLLQFLQSNKAYLTFGADTETTLSWTSTISNSLTHKTKFQFGLEDVNNPYGEMEMKSFIAAQSEIGFELGTNLDIEIGQDSERTEEAKRTVTVTLADDNDGKRNQITLTFYFLTIILFIY